MLQYWHLFSFNDYQHRFCFAVCKDQHGGDWDAQVQVQLNAELQPEGVWFSRHTADHPGNFVGAGAVHWLNQTHPIVTIDSGGHVAFASPEDFCADHQANIGPIHINPGDAVWADDASAANLHQIECNSNSPQAKQTWPLVGGTVWHTVSGGPVTQSTTWNTTPTVRLTGNVGGPLTLLGQYNPGTETCGANCAGTASGVARPLNGQVFIQYSGFWGNPSLNGVGFPPRGPVFQGYLGSSDQYTSWYNQASSSFWQPSPALLTECGLSGLTPPCSPGSTGVLAFGDSIAAGYGLGPSGPNAGGSADGNVFTYSAVLASRLGLPERNLAVEGDNASGVHNQICASVNGSPTATGCDGAVTPAQPHFITRPWAPMTSISRDA